MVEVVSLGSINVDRTRYLTTDEIADLSAGHDWFPEPGETKSIEQPPETIVDGPYENYLGGKAANQAVASARAGAETALLGKVGLDADEYAVKETLRQRGVEVGHVGPAAVPTGKAYIFVDETGENHIAIVAGANGQVNAEYVNANQDVVTEASVLVFQNEIPTQAILTMLDHLEGNPDGPLVIFDPAPVAGATEIVGHPALDLLSPNKREYEMLRGALPGEGTTVIRRQGPDDVIVADGNQEQFRLTPPTVDPVDTTGAGDVFNGYLAAGLARGDDLKTAVEWATAAASYSTELPGAQQAIPEREVVAEVNSV